MKSWFFGKTNGIVNPYSDQEKKIQINKIRDERQSNWQLLEITMDTYVQNKFNDLEEMNQFLGT